MTFGTPRLIAAGACLAACAVVLVAGPINPPAGPVQSTQLALDDVESRTPLTSEFVGSGPSDVFRVRNSGHYFLTEDLEVPAGLNGIAIERTDVTIDLNGFTIRGVAGAADAIRSVGTLEDITVRNGRIESVDDGIRIGGATSSRILVENVVMQDLAGSGVIAGRDITVRGCKVDSVGNSIVVFTLGRIENCDVVSERSGITSGFDSIIRNNRVESGASGLGSGIDADDRALITGNVVNALTGTGIRAGDSTVSDNVINGPGFGTGILSAGMSRGNTVREFDTGIQHSGGSIVDNVIIECSSSGINASNCHIEGNTINLRVETGIFSNGRVTIINNTINDIDGAQAGTAGSSGIFIANDFATVENNTFKSVGVGIAALANRRAIVRGNTALNVSNPYPIALNSGNFVGPIEVLGAGNSTIASNSPFANFDIRP